MPAKFDSDELFGGGPSRATIGPSGEYVLLNARVNPFQAGSQAVGPLEQTIILTGRIIAVDEGELDSRLAVIAAKLTDPPVVATLTDAAGREWPDMAFVRFEPAGPIDRAREVSLAFRAEFIRLA